MANKADQKAAAAHRADLYSRAVARRDIELARAALEVVRVNDGDRAAGNLVRDELDRRTGRA